LSAPSHSAWLEQAIVTIFEIAVHFQTDEQLDVATETADRRFVLSVSIEGALHGEFGLNGTTARTTANGQCVFVRATPPRKERTRLQVFSARPINCEHKSKNVYS